MAISWAGDTRINGSQAAITGISLSQPGEAALRLGHLPRCLGFWPLECFGARVTEVRPCARHAVKSLLMPWRAG